MTGSRPKTSARWTSSSSSRSAPRRRRSRIPAGSPTDEESLERTGVMIGSGIGGLPGIAETSMILHEKGPRRISPFFIPVVSHQPRLGPGLDQIRLQGAESRRRHGVLDRRACDRRCRAADPVGRRRCDGRRRRRSGRVPDRPRRLCRRARAVDRVQRRAAARLASLGRAARRLRHGRGRGHRRARRAGACQEARRQDLCRDHRLRHVGRRLSHHRAGRGRQWRLPRDAQRAEARGPRQGRHRLHQRARHLDAAWATRSSSAR